MMMIRPSRYEEPHPLLNALRKEVAGIEGVTGPMFLATPKLHGLTQKHDIDLPIASLPRVSATPVNPTPVKESRTPMANSIPSFHATAGKLYIQEAPFPPMPLGEKQRQARCYVRPVVEDARLLQQGKGWNRWLPNMVMELCVALSIVLFIVVASWILTPSMAAPLQREASWPSLHLRTPS